MHPGRLSVYQNSRLRICSIRPIACGGAESLKIFVVYCASAPEHGSARRGSQFWRRLLRRLLRREGDRTMMRKHWNVRSRKLLH
jgi:hypothetical protein